MGLELLDHSLLISYISSVVLSTASFPKGPYQSVLLQVTYETFSCFRSSPTISTVSPLAVILVIIMVFHCSFDLHFCCD